MVKFTVSVGGGYYSKGMDTDRGLLEPYLLKFYLIALTLLNYNLQFYVYISLFLHVYILSV